MNLINWQPFNDFDNLFDRYNRMWRRGLPARERESIEMADWTPVADIVENDKEFLIKAELPGVEKKDIHVAIDNGVITLKGERKYDKEEKDEKRHRMESFRGSFTRSFTLPENVNADKIRAESVNGVLTIHLPKLEKVKAKAVEVEIA